MSIQRAWRNIDGRAAAEPGNAARAIKHIKNDQTETIEIGGNGSEWVLDQGAKIMVAGSDGISNEYAKNLHLTIEGSISVSDPNIVTSAVRLGGARNSILVEDTGKLAGHVAIMLQGDKAHVVNEGKLYNTDMGVGTGIAGESKDFDIENHGKIIGGGSGVDLYGYGKLVNGEDGLITGLQGIRVLDTTGSTIINHGQVLAEGWAVITSDGSDRLVNRGHMEGAVDLGGGADHADMRHGEFLGAVIGGAGNDVFFIDDSQIELREGDGEGYDIIWTTASYTLQDAYCDFEVLGAKGAKNISLTGNSGNNNIAGNSGKNDLSGQDGDDIFYSGAGKDHLLGDGGDDTFVFRKGDGHDTIGDYTFDGGQEDVIDLHFLNGFKDLADVLAVATDTADGVVLKLGKGDSLTIADVTVANLDQLNFDYAT